MTENRPGPSNDDEPPGFGNPTPWHRRAASVAIDSIGIVVGLGAIALSTIGMVYVMLNYGLVQLLAAMLVVAVGWLTARRAGFTLSRTWFLGMSWLEDLLDAPRKTLGRTISRARAKVTDRDGWNE
jgi:hypothetical protein